MVSPVLGEGSQERPVGVGEEEELGAQGGVVPLRLHPVPLRGDGPSGGPGLGRSVQAAPGGGA